MYIKTWVLLIINSLVLVAVLLLSATFYQEFSKVLDDRILLHLNSIKNLKQIQLERLINREWEAFQNSSFNDTSGIVLPKQEYLSSGIYDLTHLHALKQTTIGLVKVVNEKRSVKFIEYEKIKEVVLERTGMGNSGESYLVGQDFRLRSQSRFMPNKTPFEIIAKTEGVQNGIKGNNGKGIFLDYRGVSVYSVYQPMVFDNVRWIILSEIDVDEVNKPLEEMRRKLLLLVVGIIILAVILSLFLTKTITNPIIKMQSSLQVMANGYYTQNVISGSNPKEIDEMFEALDSLKRALAGAVDFSTDVGEMNLISTYEPQSSDDLLGHSLLKMRDKLIAYRTIEKETNLAAKRILVERLENERRRLSRELHDGIGPLLTTLKFYVQNNIEDKEHKKEMKSLIDTAISEIRLMTNALMPTALYDFGVGATLSVFVQSLKKSVDTSIDFEDLTKGKYTQITKDQEVNLFRIAQELLNNTIKHTQADQIRLTLSEFEDFVSLYYFDDGGGFEINNVTQGSGIANIKERVEIFNGSIEIQTTSGTTIFEIELPIEPHKHD